MSTILSGIQPSGKLHLGNYFGAVKQWIELQKDNDCYIMIADLHALTSPYNPKKFQDLILETTRDLLAAGIDPQKCIIFKNSEIPEHTELAWLLQTITPLGELERMTQFKEKSEERQNINVGLLTYPVLQTADVLLYDIDKVPVGKDQIQHLELARTIAKKFNYLFGETFKEPESLLPKTGAKIMSLTEPNKKMSKSHGERTYIALSDTAEIIIKKIKSAVTDSGTEIKFDPKNKPAIANLLTIFSLVSNKAIPILEKEFSNKGYGEFKEALAQALVQYLRPIQEKRQQLDKNKIGQILEQGKKKAQKIARRKLNFIKKKMGII